MTTSHSNAGYWMLIGIAIMISLPPVMGHFVMPPEKPITQHADATAR